MSNKGARLPLPTLASLCNRRSAPASPSLAPSCLQDYNNLCQCESLEDVKLNLQETDYDQFLSSDTKVTPAAIQDKATHKLVGRERSWCYERRTGLVLGSC